MKDSIEMSRRVFYIIVGLCAFIILSNSLETMMRVKDNRLFEMWMSSPSVKTGMIGQTPEQLYSTYLTGCLSNFLVKVAMPMGLAVHSYFSLVKLRVNKLYVIIWTILLIGSFALSLIGNLEVSIFLILNGIGYAGLVLMMIHLGKCVNNAIRL